MPDEKAKITRRDFLKGAGAAAAGAAVLAAAGMDAQADGGPELREVERGAVPESETPAHLGPDAVEIVCVLDRSGSMSGRVSDTINGFNSFLYSQQTEPGEAALTLVLFDDRYEVVYDRVPIRRVPMLDGATYWTRGSTALLDAVGKAIGVVRGRAGEGKRVMVLILTDGLENASREWTGEGVKRLVEQRKAAGWKFVFLGADVDAFAAARIVGLADSAFSVSAAYDGATGRIETQIAARDGSVAYRGAGGNLMGHSFEAARLATQSFRRTGEVKIGEEDERDPSD